MRLVFWTVMMGSVISFQSLLIGQDVTVQESATELFATKAKEYVFTTHGQELDLRKQPLLHWSNPARRGEDGSLFLWTDGDRPVIVGTCFTYQYNERVNYKHAFLLVSGDAVQGRHRDRVMWNPRTDGLAFRPLPDGSPPAATAVQRNSQLRATARRFSVTLSLKDGRTEQCRLVPQPLYRYDSDELDKPCGAIFSIAVGTDPEAMLILDRRKSESGVPVWHYALGRFTYYPLEGFLDGQSIWRAEQLENMLGNILTRPDYQTEHYITFRPTWLE